MKLIKKKDKTNNGVRTLLKKLKRHDTMVVAMAVVIALILCGGLIYISTPVVAAEAKEEFIESERENNELTKEKLQEIRDYLDELDKVVTSNQSSLNSISEKTGDSKSTDKLHTQSEQIKSDTQKLIVETEKITTKIDEKVTALDGKLEEVHKNIESTTSKIEEFKTAFEEDSTRDAEELKKNFDQVGSDLEKIQQQYEEAMKQTKELNDTLAKDIDGKHTALLAKLDEMYKNMEEFNTNAFEGFKNDISTLSSNLTAQISDIDQDIQNYSTSVDNKFNEMNTSVNNKFDTVNNKFETINNNVVTDIEDLKSFLAGEMGSLNNQLSQVFQSVSDGKKLLASTLLTKGVRIAEDATFLEISRAIESIETKVMVEKLEGTVVYDRHYHLDGNGEKVEAESVSNDKMGGCFTKPIYHTHVSTCYKKTSHLSYRTDSGTSAQYFVKEENGKSVWHYKCSNCGAQWDGTNGWHGESASSMDQVRARGGESVKTVWDTTIVCGKNGSTIDGYAPACGYLSGQILAAHIDYSHNKNISSEAAAAINTSHMIANTGRAGIGLSELTAFDLNAYLAGDDFGDCGDGEFCGDELHEGEGDVGGDGFFGDDEHEVGVSITGGAGTATNTGSEAVIETNCEVNTAYSGTDGESGAGADSRASDGADDESGSDGEPEPGQENETDAIESSETGNRAESSGEASTETTE